MRAPGEILLVSCYELGHQPLNLASPLAFLTRAGYAPAAVDTSVQRLSDEVIALARFVGISVPMHTALRLGVRIAERIRAVNPAAHICFYGLYAALNAGYLLRGHAEAVISGEYEQALLDLIEKLASGRAEPVEGVGTWREVARPVMRRLLFAAPDRQGLPGLERYARLEQNGELKLAGYVEASRGCLHTCLHCPITPVYRGRFFAVPKEIVLQDIAWQVERGAEHITFGDPDFLNGPGHAMRIVRALHAAFPEVTFDATIKIEHILEHRQLFAELRELGCVFILSAVESLNDTVLRRLAKGHTRRDVIEALEILRPAGIPLRASFVPFTPWAALDDYIEMLEFVAAHGLIDHVDPVQYAIRLLVPPGSALLDEPSARHWVGGLDAALFTYTWTHPDPRMDRLHREVSERVEEAARANEDPWTTFSAVKELAYAAQGRVPPARPTAQPAPCRQPPPRLTESWFC